MKSPLNSWRSTRPPRSIENFASPLLSIGGSPAFIQNLPTVSHVPACAASFAWGSPGFMVFIHAAFTSSSVGIFTGVASGDRAADDAPSPGEDVEAEAQPAARIAARTRIEVRLCMADVPFSRVPGIGPLPEDYVPCPRAQRSRGRPTPPPPRLRRGERRRVRGVRVGQGGRDPGRRAGPGAGPPPAGAPRRMAGRPAGDRGAPAQDPQGLIPRGDVPRRPPARRRVVAPPRAPGGRPLTGAPPPPRRGARARRRSTRAARWTSRRTRGAGRRGAA